MTKVNWWKAGAYSKGDAPKAYEEMLADPDKQLEDVGYLEFKTIGSEFDPVELHIHQHSESGYLVEVWIRDAVLSNTFVAHEEADCYFATEFLKIAANQATVNMSPELQMLSSTFNAFVRHGIGKETIDEHGYTKDQREFDAAIRESKLRRERREAGQP